MNVSVGNERTSPRLRTPEQMAAIDATRAIVFVSAGAGTGKTSVLVERYIRAVLDEGRPPRDVPTVTFTRKAAGEMRQRIRKELAARGRDDLAWELDAALIGTIHSLCARLLRAHALQAGLDPGFSVLEEDRAAILLEETAASVWNRRLEMATLPEIAVLSRHDTTMRRAVPELYQGLRQLGVAGPRFVPADPGVLETSQPGSTGPARGTLLETVYRVLDVAPGFAPGGIADRNAAMLRQMVDRLESPSDGATWSDLERVAGLRPHLGVARPHKPLFSELAGAVQDAVEELGRGYLARLASIVDTLLVEFGALYGARKSELLAMDFVDLELHALRLLRAGVRPYGPSALLLVDEFQDTNGLQCTLLDLLGAGSVFTVGDRQQSIYGFRGADVAVFEERQERVATSPEDDALLALLTTNFRSSAPLLQAINRLFGSSDLFGDDYQPLHPLETGSGSGQGVAAPTALEIVVVDRQDHGEESLPWAEIEARVVAERVHELIDGGRAHRDVVVLLRALTYVTEYEAALRREGLPCYIVQGRGFYSRQELSDVLALLRVLVDPHDDLALATVLRSPIGRFSDDVLFLAREHGRRQGRRFLWEAVADEALADESIPGVSATETERLVEFRHRLEALRRQVGSPGIATLLEEAVSLFDYDLALLSDSDGRRRYANVRKLMRLADDFESLEGPDLAAFLAHLEARKDLDASREGSAAVLAEEEDVVRIMTIHQAKGLEFPVVVVAGLASVGREQRPTFMYARPSVSGVDKELQVPQALCLPGPPAAKGGPLTLGPVGAIADALAERERQERVRLAYVAATRAKEQLLLVGTPPVGSNASFERSTLAAMLCGVGETCSSVFQHEVGESWTPSGAAGVVLTVAGPSASLGEACSAADGAPRVSATVLPAPPRPLPTPARRTSVGHVSFSSLSEYARCPRKYYLERVLGLRGDRFEASGVLGPGSVDEVFEGGDPGGWRLGVAVHAVLEHLDLVQEPSEDALRGVMGRKLAAAELMGVDHDATARLVRAFWRSPVASLPGLGAAAKEESFVFLHRDTPVTGVIDLVGGGGHERWVIDYKTNRLGGRTPSQAAEPYALQGQIYALALLLSGVSSVAVHFLFLERPEEPVRDVYTRQSIPSLEAALDAAMEGLLEGDYPPGTGCESCDLETVCSAVVGSRDRQPECYPGP